MSQSSCMLYLTHAYFKIKLSVGHKNVVKENKVRNKEKKKFMLHLYYCFRCLCKILYWHCHDLLKNSFNIKKSIFE